MLRTDESVSAAMPDGRGSVAELLETLELPCITTDEGCSLEAAAGLGGVDEADGLALGEMRAESAATEDPCWWDQGCYAFA